MAIYSGVITKPKYIYLIYEYLNKSRSWKKEWEKSELQTMVAIMLQYMRFYGLIPIHCHWSYYVWVFFSQNLFLLKW